MIKAIIFDLGNVVLKFDNNIFLKRISGHTNKSVEELNKIIYQESGLPKQYESGRITTDEFIRRCIDICELNITREEFIEAYTRIFSPIDTTVNLINKLLGKYQLALLSNTSELDYQYFSKGFEVVSLLTPVSLSYEVGAMKPDKEIFLDMLNKLKFIPGECIYIDDMEEYAKAASRLGIHGIHYVSYNGLISDLEKFGITI
jgi:HAD superfamily hydrolase (TIGR01509 family)